MQNIVYFSYIQSDGKSAGLLTTLFQRNMDISSILCFSTLTSINIKYGVLMNTLWLMVFTEDHINGKTTSVDIGLF